MTSTRDQDLMLMQTLWLLAQMTPKQLECIEPELVAIIEESQQPQEKICSRTEFERILTTGER